jgi:uncharacterized membrane protein YkoI
MTSARGYDDLAGKKLIWVEAVFILTAVLLFPCAASAAEQKGTTPAQETAAATGAKISREQATQAALAELPGEVTDVTIERKRGKMVYVIEIVAKKNGAETDVLVDMDSGKVLGME